MLLSIFVSLSNIPDDSLTLFKISSYAVHLRKKFCGSEGIEIMRGRTAVDT